MPPPTISIGRFGRKLHPSLDTKNPGDLGLSCTTVATIEGAQALAQAPDPSDLRAV